MLGVMLIVILVLLIVIIGLLIYLDWYATDKLLEVSAATRTDWHGSKKPFDWKQEQRIRILLLVLFGAGFALCLIFCLWIGKPVGKSIWISLLGAGVLVGTKGSFMTYMLLFHLNRQNKKAEKVKRENAEKLWEPDS